MAVAAYNTDLATIDLCDNNSSYIEFSGYALGDGAAVETDWYLQGTHCASDEANGKTGVGHSIGVDYGSNVTFNTGDCFFAWMQCQAGNAVDTYANGGYRVLMGSSTSVFYGWYVGGSDFGRNPYGGWTNVAVDPTATAQDTGHGTPTTWRYFGVGFKMISAISKGRPINADAMRYGRGEIYTTDGQAGAYGTFAGLAAANDGADAKWGLFQKQGTGYLWKGLLSFGQSATSCDFRDSNVNITIDDTPRTYAAFNKIEINNASSNVEWTNVNFETLNESGTSVGSFEMVDNATVTIIGGAFTGMSTFIFDSNAELTRRTFRRCGLVTGGGASFTDCIFEESDAASAITVATINDLDGCVFIKGASGHAVELTGAAGSYSWTGITTGYDTGTAGEDVEVTGGSITGDETIHVTATTGTVVINVATGATVPSVSSAGASVDVVSSFNHTIIGLELDTEVTYVTAGTSTELFHVESASTSDGAGKYKTVYSHAGGATVDILIHHKDYVPDINNQYGLVLPSADASIKVNMVLDGNYENPT